MSVIGFALDVALGLVDMVFGPEPVPRPVIDREEAKIRARDWNPDPQKAGSAALSELDARELLYEDIRTYGEPKEGYA